MSLRERAVAFAPLTALTLLTALAAVAGLGSAGSPAITATDWPNAVRQLLEAPGARFTYVTTDQTLTAREKGILTFDPLSYDSERAFDDAEERGLSDATFSFRAVGDERFVKLGPCWSPSPVFGSTVPDAVALLATSDPAVRAPAPTVLELLGVPRVLWEHDGFSRNLRQALGTMSLPVSWLVEDGDLVIRFDGRAIARALAADFPDEWRALSVIAARDAAWRVTPLDSAPAAVPTPRLCAPL